MAINIKPSRKGLLHKKLGVPQGQPIPMAKIKKAEKSPSPALRKEANFADNAKGFNHTGPKPKAKPMMAPKRSNMSMSMTGDTSEVKRGHHRYK